MEPVNSNSPGKMDSPPSKVKAGSSADATSVAKSARKSKKRNIALASIKPVFFLAALLPLGLLVLSVFTGTAGPNPIEVIEEVTGEWALRFLLLTLCATPLTRWFKWLWPARLRRMIGLFSFFYATLHLLVYVWLNHNWVLRDILYEIVEKPFITAGFLCFVILLPLAVTSNKASVKALGIRWRGLHQWVYFAALLGVLHYVWLAKGDRLEPIVYLVILVFLLMVRLPKVFRQR